MPDSQWANRFFQQTVTDNPYLSRRIPSIWEGPSAKQYVFLTYPAREMMYGGAAGGGKSVALLAAALQFATVPGYSALLLRRTFADLNLPKALIPLSHLFLQETDARWDGQKYRWTFPSGATLSFGYLATDIDKYRYQGAEFSFLGFDELTQFTESQYNYLRSRLRKPANLNVPLRVRSSSNPGGVGHVWVKNRFIDPKTRGNRKFVSARLEDNPHLDRQSYEESLNELDPVTRQQLRHGDWDASVDNGIFKAEWIRRYDDEGDFYRLCNSKGETWLVKKSDCRKYATMDVAASERTQADWSVLQLWGLTPSYDMLLLDQWRGQKQIPDVVAAAARKCWEWDVEFLGVEKDGVGIAAMQTLRQRGITVKALATGGKDKIKRATAATIRMEAGMVYFPKAAEWLEQAVEEILLFPNPGGHDDVVDTFSWAAHLAQRMGGAPRSIDAEKAIENKDHRIADAEETAKHPGSSISPDAVTGGADDDEEIKRWLAGE